MKLLILIFLLPPLQTKESLTIQFSFDFSYKIDTYSNRLTTHSPDTVVSFQFSDAQRKTILHAIDSLGVFSFPDTIRYLTRTEPRFGPYILRVQTNHGKKSIIWYEIPDPTTPHLKQFVFFKNMLRNMVYQTKAYKALNRPINIIN